MHRRFISRLVFASVTTALFASGIAGASAPPVGRTQVSGVARRPQIGIYGVRATPSYTVVPNFLAGLSIAARNPEQSPAGANVACRLTVAHPYPVVLVHGTFEDMEDNWGAVAPILANNGYCVYALNYGAPANALLQAVGAIPASAATVASYFKAVLAATKATKIDVVGHSQGGTVLEYVAKFFGGAAYIHNLVALAPSTHGTTASGLLTLEGAISGANAPLGSACQACIDQEVGSPVIRALDTPPIAEPGPKYTIVETRFDEVITPSTNAFIQESGVTNEYVQSFCPFDSTDHEGLNYDLAAITLVMNALDPAAAQRPNCFLAYPFPA